MLLIRDSKSTQLSGDEPLNFDSESVECGIGTVGRSATGAVAVELCAVDVPNDVNEVAVVVLFLFPLFLLLLTLLA